MSIHATCPLCEIADRSEVVTETVRDDPLNRFKILRCHACGHLFLFPHPTASEDKAFYDADLQARNLMKQFSNNSAEITEAELSHWQKRKSIDTDRRMDWLANLIHVGEQIIDVGCGYGVFVDAATKRGYQAIGIDPSKIRVERAGISLQGRFIHGDLDEGFVTEGRERFSAVTLFHVLEHIREPVFMLQKCFELVKPGGVLLIEVPNVDDELLEYNHEYRSFHYQRSHYNYFNASGLKLAFDRSGIKQFSVSGVQRYGLRNLIHWLDHRKPMLSTYEFRSNDSLLSRVEQQYCADRENALTCDTLIAHIQK